MEDEKTEQTDSADQYQSEEENSGEEDQSEREYQEAEKTEDERLIDIYNDRADRVLKSQERSISRLEKQIDNIILTGIAITTIYSLLIGWGAPSIGISPIRGLIAVFYSVLIPVFLIFLIIKHPSTKRLFSAFFPLGDSQASNFRHDKATDILDFAASSSHPRSIELKMKGREIEENWEIEQKKWNRLKAGYITILYLIFWPLFLLPIPT